MNYLNLDYAKAIENLEINATCPYTGSYYEKAVCLFPCQHRVSLVAAQILCSDSKRTDLPEQGSKKCMCEEDIDYYLDDPTFQKSVDSIVWQINEFRKKIGYNSP